MFNHLADVCDIEARAVEGAVARLTGEQFDNRAHPALAHRILAFNQQGARAHAKDRAVPPPVKRQRGLFNLVIGGGGTAGKKARADPFQQPVAGHVIGTQHQDTAAAPAANPVLGDGNTLRG